MSHSSPLSGGSELGIAPSRSTGLSSVAPDPRSNDLGRSLGFDDRIVTVEAARALNGGSLPDDTITLRSETRSADVVLKCPLTHMPLTHAMADFVKLGHEHLQNMVDRLAPLGLPIERWRRTLITMRHAFDAAGMLDDDLTIKVGGSSTHCFSSRATALKKKQFPGDERMLDIQLRNAAARSHLTLHDVELAKELGARRLAKLSSAVPRRPDGTARLPQAPWWGALHRLGIEPRPDIDIQIHHPKIDALMTEHPALRSLVANSRSGDMWNRWPALAVFAEVPALDDLHARLAHHSSPVDMEFLAGSTGQQRARSRTDWWTIVGQ